MIDMTLKKKIGFAVAVLMTAAAIAFAWSYTVTHRSAVIPAATELQWVADSSWTKGGWR
jgi:hypothetical protein